MSIIAQKNLRLIQEGSDVFCDSRQLAKQFSKRHKDVLKKIENEIELFGGAKLRHEIPSFFIEADYGDRGKRYKRYKLTFKGFQQIALSFTGRKAFENRLKFINFFEYLLKNIEKDKLTALMNSKNVEWLDFRQEGKIVRRKFTDAIKEHITEYRMEVEGKMNDGRYYMNYTKMIYKSLGVDLPTGVMPTRDTVGARTLLKIEILEEKIADQISKYAKEGMHYKEVYQKIKEIIS